LIGQRDDARPISSRRWGAVGLLVFALSLCASAAACGKAEPASQAPAGARTPAQAVRLYNQALVAGDFRAACRLLTRLGQDGAVGDGRQATESEASHPTTCPAALKVVVPDTPEYRKLARARVVRVRPAPGTKQGRIVTQRFPDRLLEDITVTRRSGRWLLVLNPYTPYA
jgi:hypothetical protein